MVGEISSIMRELAEVQDRMMTLSTSDQDEKLALLTKQDELQTRAARLAEKIDDRCSTQDLLARLAGLRRQRAAMERQRADSLGTAPAFRPGSFGSGMQPGPMGPRGRASTDPVLRIEDRIRRIRSLLEDRGIELR